MTLIDDFLFTPRFIQHLRVAGSPPPPPHYVIDLGDVFHVVHPDDCLVPKAVCLTREAGAAAVRLLNS